MLELALIGAGSYLIGATPVAVIVCAALGKGNPLAAGSRNPGATNVTRLHGKGIGALVLALDCAKGALAVVIAAAVAEEAANPSWAVALALLGVNVGHAKSVFLRFSGGKSVASGLGSMAVAAPWLALAALATWLTVFAIWRISALSAVVAYALLAPLTLAMWLSEWVALPGMAEGLAPAIALAILALCALVLVRHRQNYPDIAKQLASR